MEQRDPQSPRSLTCFTRLINVLSVARAWSWTGVAALVIIWGCAGGGGSGGGSGGDPCTNPTSVTVNYTTFWGNAPLTASQVIQLIDETGSVQFSDAIPNRLGQASSTLQMTNAVLPGFYELRATLYSQSNAGGTVLGVASAAVDGCADSRETVNVSVRTSFGATPTRIDVSPSTVTLKEQQSQKFVASAEASNGNAVFIAPGSLTWTVLGGIGTVDQAGFFTATDSGNGSVRAELANPELIASANVKVDPFIVTQGKWTVMVFMNAANDLYFASDLNVNQMERVAQNPDVRFVVQWKQTKSIFPGSSFDGVRRYLVKPDLTDDVVSEVVQSNLVNGQGQALDMGDPQVLNNFITWAKTFYPADRYVLILWNHGNGWRRSPGHPETRAFSYDDQYGTSIQIWEADEAFAGHHLDVVAWDSSLMQMMEVAYEMRSYFSYIVGSEESPPAEGYPYNLVFSEFRDNPDLPTATLTKAFVDGMLAHPPYFTREITQSSVDTSKLAAVRTALDDLAALLTTNKDALATQIQFARNNAEQYGSGPTRYYRDIIHLCELLKTQGGVPGDVVAACDAVIAAVTDAVVQEGHNAQSPNSRGLAIDFSPGDTFQIFRSDYIRMKFAQDSLWDEFLGLAP